MAYNVLAWLLLFACMNNLGMAFMLLKAEWSLRFWATFYYSVFWIPLVVIAVCRYALPRPKRDPTTKGHTSAAPRAAKPAADAAVRTKEL